MGREPNAAYLERIGGKWLPGRLSVHNRATRACNMASNGW